MMRRLLLAALAALFFAAPALAQPSSGSGILNKTAAQLLAISCSSSNEGQLARVRDSLSSLAVAAGGSFALTARCHDGRWQAEPDLGDIAMSGPNNGWSHYPKNPLFDNDVGPGSWPQSACTSICIWNDIDVKANGGDFLCPGSPTPSFCALVTVGVLGTGENARIFYITSSDGVAWTLGNSGTPVLQKGGVSDFDSYGVETPSWVDTMIAGPQRYRLCYTAYDSPPATTYYTMGCAYSSDGLSWTKTGEVPMCAAKVQQAGNPWGYFACAEPSLRYVAADSGTEIKLYFAEPRCRTSACTGFPSAERAIGLAESALDWSGAVTFTEVDGDSSTAGTQPIVRQREEHDPALGWDGYSTPHVWCGTVSGGITSTPVNQCLLSVSVFRQDGDGFHQRAIALFGSTDGLTGRVFRMDNPSVISVWSGQDWWTTWEVRSPSIMKGACGVGGATALCMYFAGNSLPGSGQGPNATLGIGLARRLP
jgi:hypothetical protein